MRLVFRADASPEIGTGHIMRSLALAEEAISRGIDCTFVGDIRGIPWLETRVNELGYSECLSAAQISEVTGDDAVLILDSYIIDPKSNWLTRKNWLSLVSIADEQTPKYFVDLVVHPGLSGDWYRDDTTDFLFGPDYVLLRKSIRKSEKAFKQEINKITIFGGGSDAFGFASIIAPELAKCFNFKHAVVYSGQDLAVLTSDSRFEVKPFGPTLDEDIESSDLVLTTASTSSLEVIARGIPIGVVCAIENQIGYYEVLGNLGVAVQIGERIKSQKWNISSSQLSELVGNFELRRSLIQAGTELINFNGAKNLLDKILSVHNSSIEHN